MARDGKGSYIWYFLRKDNPGKVKKVTNRSLQAYIDTLNGKKPSGIKSYEQLTDACFCYHYVVYSEKCVPSCEFNAEELCCPTCKAFKLYGICSHICTVNHLLEVCDLDDALKELSAPRKTGGFRSIQRGNGEMVILRCMLFVYCGRYSSILCVYSAAGARIRIGVYVFLLYPVIYSV